MKKYLLFIFYDTITRVNGQYRYAHSLVLTYTFVMPIPQLLL